MRNNTLRIIALCAAVLMTLSACGDVAVDADDPEVSDAPTVTIVTPPPLPSPTPEPTPPPTPAPWELFAPHALPETDPALPRVNYRYNIQSGGAIVSEFLNPEPIFFGLPGAYTDVPGITTFRGNNFRDSASYGTADIEEERLEELYRVSVGSLRNWPGVGWTGQPAIVRWDYDVQRQMNLLPEKRDKEGLVEVIQGALDGFIYFFDLEDGQPTRERLRFGEPIKGAVTVDPRGYPILYVGQGDMFLGSFGFYIFSLIDFSRMHFIDGHDPFAHRTWGAFDANPLFDIPNDRMILCGENGVIYNVKLNTEYDRAAGTVSVAPVSARYRYTTNITGRWGIESSPAAFSHYLFTADNDGVAQCIDLMTFTPVWVRSVTDDTDATIALEWEEDTGTLALYTGCEVDLQGPGGIGYIRKLNAENGDLLWEVSYPCLFDEHANGGIMASPVVGRGDIADYVIFYVARTRVNSGGGILVCLDKRTGDIVWETRTASYGWSSPVAVYTGDGTGYLVVCDSAGNMFMVRGATGEILDTIRLGSNIEASPAVYGDMIVVGTRGQRVIGVRIR